MQKRKDAMLVFKSLQVLTGIQNAGKTHGSNTKSGSKQMTSRFQQLEITNPIVRREQKMLSQRKAKKVVMLAPKRQKLLSQSGLQPQNVDVTMK